MMQPAHGTSRQLQLGDEEQIDERLARRAHELEGRLAKFGTAGIQKPKDLLEFVNNVKEFCKKVNSQLSLYRGKKGVFARDWIMEAAAETPSYMWWDQNGGSVPELQTVACLVLSQPASARPSASGSTPSSSS